MLTSYKLVDAVYRTFIQNHVKSEPQKATGIPGFSYAMNLYTLARVILPPLAHNRYQTLADNLDPTVIPGLQTAITVTRVEKSLLMSQCNLLFRSAASEH